MPALRRPVLHSVSSLILAPYEKTAGLCGFRITLLFYGILRPARCSAALTALGFRIGRSARIRRGCWFAFSRRFFLAVPTRAPAGRGTRGRPMIRRIKTGAFKDNPYRRIHLVQRFLSTLRAARQRSVGKFLVSFKLDTAVFTPVGIDRHTEPQT